MATRSDRRLRPQAVLAVIVAAVLSSCAAGPSPMKTTTAPLHFFVSDRPQRADVLVCGISGRRETLGDIWRHPISPCQMGSGITRPSPGGTSSAGARSAMTVRLNDTDWSMLSLRIRSQSHPDPERRQTVTVVINDVPLPAVSVPAAWRTLRFEIPDDSLLPGDNTIQLEFGFAVSPSETGRGKGTRRVAATLAEVWLARRGARRASWARIETMVASPPGGPGATQIWDEATNRFVVSSRGILALPVEIPAGADRLHIQVEPSADLDLARSSAVLHLEGLDGSAVSTRDLLPAVAEGNGNLQTTVEVPTANAAGGTVLATIELDPRPRGATVGISYPRPQPGPPAAVSPTGDRPAGGTPGDPPDIVLITLDAARADHLSCYGYPRPTTPLIDDFAERSLVFANAFALAPYTLCSVPTMITGLSFLDHGVVGHQDTLAQEATTLGESLSAAGYRTACFSASPNNSKAKRFDQGYDEFHELWNEVERSTSRDPHYVSKRVIEWLEAFDDDRPLHLQVHYIPPHAPYRPAEPFNIFANLAYGGPCTGAINSFDAVERGRVPNTERCLAHLIDLYDGNLRAADDATGQLLEALSRRRRWPNTVVLITSDHGEAFLEHGQMTHNSTVYDEMLKVPFILRLPEGMSHEAIDTRQLVTLADIVPTLLSFAGLHPPDGIDGVDLLRSATTAGSVTGRYFVARNSDVDPVLGLRSLRWKAMLSSSGFGGLFDLATDPGEQRNVVFDRRAEFAALGLMLTDRVSRPPNIEATTERAEVGQRDREMLEALGYVDTESPGGDSPTAY